MSEPQLSRIRHTPRTRNPQCHQPPTHTNKQVPALRGWVALLTAALGGFFIELSMPDVAFWPAAFLGVSLVLASLWQQRIIFSMLLGAVAGACFWLPLLSWLTTYLGPVPWLALSGLMIIWFSLNALATAIATRGLALKLATKPRLLATLQTLTVTGLWVGREQLQGSWPYGGFPWGRLAHALSEAPIASTVSWLGFAGTSALIALIAAVPVALAFSPLKHTLRTPRSRSLRIIVATGACASAILLLTLLPPASLKQLGTIRVAAVQGNAQAGIFDDRESGDVLNTHLDTTRKLLNRLETHGDSVDLIVWPENSAEFDLRHHTLAQHNIATLSRQANAPIIVGTILEEHGTYTNSSLVWGPQGDQGIRYDKTFPVPFAEYMPNREFFHALAPDLVDLVQLEYTAGNLSPVVTIPVAGKHVRAGLAICFDIIFDQQAVNMQHDDAMLILAQTNNADFGRSDESVQQLSIARLRAIETGRALVNISTVGTSAIISSDAHDLTRLTPFTAESMVAQVSLVEGETPAMRWGACITLIWITIGVSGAIAGTFYAAKRRHENTNTA